MPGQVSKFLDGVLGSTKIDSEAQLRAAQSQRFTAEQEREARANGFASAQAMYEFSRQRQIKRGVTDRNVDVHKMKQDVTAWHPAVMLQNVLNAIQGATGGK